jgi:hypothetical protein
MTQLLRMADIFDAEFYAKRGLFPMFDRREQKDLYAFISSTFNAGLLKVFGLSTAVVPTISANGTTFETITDPNPAPPVGERRLQEMQAFIERDYYHAYDVVHEYLYSALEVGRRQEPQGSMLVEPSGTRFDRRVIDCRPMYELFNYGLGDYPAELGGKQATLTETNLCQAARLDIPETYAVGRIGILFSPLTRPEVRRSFAERYAFELWLGKKEFWRAPVASAFAVGEIDAMDSPAIGWCQLAIPLMIVNQMSFFVRLVGTPDPDDELRLWAVLGNYHARGVQ